MTARKVMHQHILQSTKNENKQTESVTSICFCDAWTAIAYVQSQRAHRLRFKRTSVQSTQLLHCATISSTLFT